MYSEIDKHLSRNTFISEGEFELLHSYIRKRIVRKRGFLLSQGEVCNFEAYIVKGCLKKYYIDDKGDEVILQFAVEDWWISDIGSFSEQKPSNLFIEALEDSELLVIDYANKEKLFEEVPGLERVFRMMIQKSYAVLENRFYSSIAKSAEERYLEFVKKYPAIVQRVPQTQIASYLGITPESLSRIKSKMFKKKPAA
ncbi:Crp/Fnr family transcriptional regulator [Desertivirga arenae]|uniref:Crp/Fnr family transcriptional regulator n=1 Tax=Desertivirga arenae TaxID=2810309 RepID=UPI001A95B419|nr:Crp/Fnr family transcriptional regulator [Pedobacter sp. SYSU D00823]